MCFLACVCRAICGNDRSRTPNYTVYLPGHAHGRRITVIIGLGRCYSQKGVVQLGDPRLRTTSGGAESPLADAEAGSLHAVGVFCIRSMWVATGHTIVIPMSRIRRVASPMDQGVMGRQEEPALLPNNRAPTPSTLLEMVGQLFAAWPPRDLDLPFPTF